MAISATYSATVTLLGNTLGSGGQPLMQDSQQTTPTNTNAPPPSSAQLVAGSITILVPTGYTVSRCTMLPPSASANAKTVKGISGDTGLSGWTTGSITVPVVAGGSFVVVSAGTETLQIGWS